MKKLTINVLAVVLIMSIVVITGSSCKKRKLNRVTTSTEDANLAAVSFEDVYKVTNDAAKEEDLEGEGKNNGIQYVFGTCATIIHEPTLFDSLGVWNSTYPKKMIIDFGGGCEGSDGKTRKGKIIAKYTGRYRNAGTQITIETDGYFVDDIQVDGIKSIINNGKNFSGNSTFSISEDGTITDAEGNTIQWGSERTREWVEGEETSFWTYDSTAGSFLFFNGILDDAYDVTGSGSGINRDGRNFTMDIITPLHIQFCDWLTEITSGTYEIQPEDLKLRTVDFGDGSCDRSASVTIGKKSYVLNW